MGEFLCLFFKREVALMICAQMAVADRAAHVWGAPRNPPKFNLEANRYLSGHLRPDSLRCKKHFLLLGS